MQTQLVTVIRWNGNLTPLPVHIYEHTKATRAEAGGMGLKDTGQKVRAAQTIWSAKKAINVTASSLSDFTLTY